MSQATLLRSSTLPAALGSLVSLGAQALMALFLLRLFAPDAVGMYSVVAQVAFGWATLALAQSQISLLANQHLPALPAARQAWWRSLQRGLWLTPAAALALWWSDRQTGAWLTAMAWTVTIATAQMGWLLAQSLTLRLHGPVSIGLVRMMPPVLAAAWVAVCALWLDWVGSAVLTAAALAGYSIGSLWMWPAWRAPQARLETRTSVASAGDTRTETLKFVHTLSDVLVATALAVHWSAVYGAAQAGCLLLLLRVTGFMPALVSTAWAQVVLGRPQSQRPSSALAATAGAVAVLAVVVLTSVALKSGWLPSAWSGLQHYLGPLALWQMAACLIAAVSHRPFVHNQAWRHSWQCLAVNALQGLLIVAPPALGWSLGTHVWTLCCAMATALCLQALWASRLGR